MNEYIKTFYNERCSPINTKKRSLATVFLKYFFSMRKVVNKKDDTSICFECGRLLMAPKEMNKPLTLIIYFVATVVLGLTFLTSNNMAQFIFSILAIVIFSRGIKAFIYSFYEWVPFDVRDLDISELRKEKRINKLKKACVFVLGCSVAILIAGGGSLSDELIALSFVGIIISLKLKKYIALPIYGASMLYTFSSLGFLERINANIDRTVSFFLILVQLYSILRILYSHRKYHKVGESSLKS